jgi:hypothetical protein
MEDENNMLENMIQALIEARADFSKFYNDGNSAAGTRVRKVMQELKTNAQNLRTHIQETKNSR